MRCLRSLLLAAVSLAVSSPALAQYGGPAIPPPVISLESSIREARTIAMGTIGNVPAWDSKYEYQEAFLSVRETLKGEPSQRADMFTNQSDEELKRWKAAGRLLLVFVPADVHSPALILNLSDPNVAVMTKNLEYIKGADAILATLRKSLKRPEPVARSGTFGLVLPVKEDPFFSDKGSKGRWMNRTTLVVPIDADLESKARTKIKNDDEGVRTNAIEALANFKNAANIDMLRPLLHDERWSATFFDIEKTKLLKRYFNNTRRAAYKALKAWGEPVPPDDDSMKPRNVDDQVVSVNLDTGKAPEADIADLHRYRFLKDLYLSNDRISQTEFLQISQLQSLQTLFLECSNVTDADLETLSRLPNLVYLGLNNTVVTDRCIESLAKFRSLKKVDLGAKITSKGIEKLRRLRPDIDARADTFAFLEVLHPRVWEYPHQAANWLFLPVGMSFEEATGLRCVVYIVPPDKDADVNRLLNEELPKRGWKAGHFNNGYAVGYSHQGVPIKGGSYGTRQVDEIQTDQRGKWFDVDAKPDERLIVITQNVDPRKV